MPPLRRRDLLNLSARMALGSAALAAAGLPRAARSQSGRSGNQIELTAASATSTEEGIFLSYTVRLELGAELEQLLQRGVALVFEADVGLHRERWYWFDQQRARAERRWRLGYQPLTRQWRLSQNGLARQFSTIEGALDAMRRTVRWRVAEALPGGEDPGEHHIDFWFRLDVEELPRPLQIGLLSQAERELQVQRRLPLQTTPR